VIWLLDTNTCIRYLNERSPALRERVENSDPSDLVVCSVVRAELFYGAAKSNRPAQNHAEQELFLSRFVSLPFDDQCAEEYARLRADLECRGTPIGPNDLLIAAIALANDVILVTHNTSEFSRVSGLKLEDWEA